MTYRLGQKNGAVESKQMEMESQSQSQLPSQARDVLDFWYHQLEPEQWWVRDNAVDKVVISRFSALYMLVANALPGSWLMTARGRLAAVIVLDQFPRNMFRGSAKTFMTDEIALALAEETIAVGLDKELVRQECSILYMPFQHSEDREVQERSMALYEALGDAGQLDFARKHKTIIDRFGRFPHRNEILGRVSSKEELEFLKAPGLFW
jgi:uncharacterized protein (DUF924 family)